MSVRPRIRPERCVFTRMLRLPLNQSRATRPCSPGSWPPACSLRCSCRFFPAAWARYADAKPGTLRIVPPDARLPELEQDYRKMQEMIYGEPPAFERRSKCCGGSKQKSTTVTTEIFPRTR